MSPSLGLYLFGANIATLRYDMKRGAWEIGSFWKRTHPSQEAGEKPAESGEHGS